MYYLKAFHRSSAPIRCHYILRQPIKDYQTPFTLSFAHPSLYVIRNRCPKKAHSNQLKSDELDWLNLDSRPDFQSYEPLPPDLMQPDSDLFSAIS